MNSMEPPKTEDIRINFREYLELQEKALLISKQIEERLYFMEAKEKQMAS